MIRSVSQLGGVAARQGGGRVGCAEGEDFEFAEACEFHIGREVSYGRDGDEKRGCPDRERRGAGALHKAMGKRSPMAGI